MPALTVCPGEELSLSAFASRLEGADADSVAAEAARAAMEANLNRHSAAAAQKENVQVMLPPHYHNKKNLWKFVFPPIRAKS